jgi:hypothetical protein
VTARLTIRPAPELGADVRYYEIDCDHGTTTALAGGASPLPDSGVVEFLLARHDEEGCTCTREVRDRYGLNPMGVHGGRKVQ